MKRAEKKQWRRGTAGNYYFGDQQYDYGYVQRTWRGRDWLAATRTGSLIARTLAAGKRFVERNWK